MNEHVHTDQCNHDEVDVTTESGMLNQLIATATFYTNQIKDAKTDAKKRLYNKKIEKMRPIIIQLLARQELSKQLTPTQSPETKNESTS